MLISEINWKNYLITQLAHFRLNKIQKDSARSCTHNLFIFIFYNNKV